MSLLSAIGMASARLAALSAWVVGAAVGALGAAGAWWFYRGSYQSWQLPLFLAVPGLLLFIAWFGERRVRRAPLKAVQAIGAKTLAMFLLAAFAATLIVIVTIEIVAPGTKPSDQDKELYGAISAAITAALTGSLIKVSEAIDAPAASASQSALQDAFKELPPDSDAYKAVYLDGWSGMWGWGPDVREWRARKAQEHRP